MIDFKLNLSICQLELLCILTNINLYSRHFYPKHLTASASIVKRYPKHCHNLSRLHKDSQNKQSNCFKNYNIETRKRLFYNKYFNNKPRNDLVVDQTEIFNLQSTFSILTGSHSTPGPCPWGQLSNQVQDSRVQPSSFRKLRLPWVSLP